MRKFQSSGVMVQAVALIVAALSIVGGVTFAALQSDLVIINGNSIVTAMAKLSLSKNNVTYGPVVDGYNFLGLVPGGTAVPVSGYPVYLKNEGSTPLAAKLSVAPSLSNPNDIDLTKVHVLITGIGDTNVQDLLMSDLVAADASGGIPLSTPGMRFINPSTSTGATMQVLMERDAMNGTQAGLSNLTFDFNATAAN